MSKVVPMARRTLLLAGKIGNGKSSTGNSILGQRVFSPSCGSSTDAKLKPIVGIAEDVSVVDGIEIGYKDNSKDDSKHAFKMADKAFSKDNKEFSALLIVLRYGSRLTKEEQDAVNLIKSLFSEETVRSKSIIVMTHGDNFDLDDEGEDFNSWCRKQTGYAQSLYNGTNGRWVLFDNKTEVKSKLDKQKRELFKLVDQIQGPVTKDDICKKPGKKNSEQKKEKGEKKKKKKRDSQKEHGGRREEEAQLENDTDATPKKKKKENRFRSCLRSETNDD